MSIPTEAERLASYKESMAKTVAAIGGRSAGPYATRDLNDAWRATPGRGAIQTADTALHIHRMAQQREAQANTLPPEEIIRADAAGRAIARQRAELAGKTLSDTDIQRAGRAGIASAAERAKS